MGFLSNVNKYVIKRRLPYGLFSWRFFMPNQSPAVQLHRDLARSYFPQLPKPLYVLASLYTGFKWALFLSPYFSLKVVKHKGESVTEETGLSLWQQYWRVLSISAGHGVAPVEWYRFRLYKEDSGKKLWDYVYDQEVGGFHQYRNRGRSQYRDHVAVLGDKQQFETLLSQQGISSVGTLAVIAKETSDFQAQLEVLIEEYGDVFCKRRTGNQGRGAFRAYREQGRVHIQPRQESVLPADKVAPFLRDNTQEYDYLIQPNYVNHPQLQSFSKDYRHPASTIRIISHYDDATGNVHPEFAVMHWPVLDDELHVRYHYPIAIDPVTGKFDQVHEVWPREPLEEAESAALEALLERIADQPLPHWSEALQLSDSVHQLLTGVDMIAWDFILTKERAVMLEGNSGWGGLAVCQWFGLNLRADMT